MSTWQKKIESSLILIFKSGSRAFWELCFESFQNLKPWKFFIELIFVEGSQNMKN